MDINLFRYDMIDANDVETKLFWEYILSLKRYACIDISILVPSPSHNHRSIHASPPNICLYGVQNSGANESEWDDVRISLLSLR